jgi:hypothetical protein
MCASGRAADAITWHACNVADPKECADLAARYRGSASVLVLSNIIHCYGESENVALLGQLQEVVERDGTVVIHDFFSDGNGFGAMYDLHMMINTYNGRTYTIDETVRMLHDIGFANHKVVALPSYSQAILARREGQEAG